MSSFEHEGECYLWLVPELQKLRSKLNLKPLAFPKCFYASAEQSLLILENMKAQDYVVVPKKIQRKLISSYCQLDRSHSHQQIIA